MIDPSFFAIDENDNQKFHRIVNALHLSVYSNDKMKKVSEGKKISEKGFQVECWKPSLFVSSNGDV